MDNLSPHDHFKIEIEMAKAARLAGNEGKARVCARRAAGIVIGEHLMRRGISPINSSAFDRLRQIRTIDDVPCEIIQVVDHFLVRVDRSQNLPIQAALIEDACWLKSRLVDF